MNYIFYIISVLESNERTSNVQDLKEKLEKLGHRVEIIPAFYHKTCNVGEVLSQNNITHNGLTWTPGIKYVTRGEICCFLSHHKAWKQIASANQNDVHIILEDDMNLHPDDSLYDFNHAPEYDAIVLYRHPEQMNTPVTYAGEGLLHFYWQWGLNAYAITPTFATEMVTSITHIEEPVDIMLHGHLFPRKRVYVVENGYFKDIGMQSVRV
jgi:GR25 family glycosyltransferase involved in LPS biosynthesis